VPLNLSYPTTLSTHFSDTHHETAQVSTNALPTLLSKQCSSSLQDIVRCSSEILDTVTTTPKQIELIKVLQDVTEGRLFVEIHRARLTKRLALIYEREGKIGDAADAILEMAVETFGAMHRSEKIAYVLGQMRLCMDNADFTRAQILSRKVCL
jgi:26S proteasome regulatory subunit N5